MPDSTRQAVPDSHVQHLTRLGTDRVAHRNGSLLRHLCGTWNLLRAWGNPESVCLAGLYHSVYSTGGFEQQLIPLSNRDMIRQTIGEQAERYVYLFAACDRPKTHPRIGSSANLLFHDRFKHEDYPLETDEWSALCEIMLANELDLGRYDHKFYVKHRPHYKDLFQRFEPWLGEASIHAKNEFDQGFE